MKVIMHDLSSELETIELYPLADMHLEDRLHDKRRSSQWLKEVMAQDNRYVICNGDLLNMAVKDAVSDTYGQKCSPNEAIDKLVEFLDPIKHKILAIDEGNHEKRVYLRVGINILERVAKELRIDKVYSPGAFLLFISFGKSQGRDCRKMVYSIYTKHGSGGGGKPGGKLNRLVGMAETIDADVYIHSHTHDPVIRPGLFYRCDYRNKKITPVEKMFVNTNAFLNHGGYGEEFGFNPVSTRYPKLIFHGREPKVSAMFD